MLVSMHSKFLYKEIYVHHQMPFIVPVFFRINRFDDVYVYSFKTYRKQLIMVAESNLYQY